MKLQRWLPVLLGTYPILALYSRNQAELALPELVLPVGVALALGFLTWAVLHLLVREERRVTVYMFFFLLWFWTGGLLYDFWSKLDINSYWEIPILVFSAIIHTFIVLVVAWTVRRSDRVVHRLASGVYFFTALLVGYSVISLVPREMARHKGAPEPAAVAQADVAPTPSGNELQPNIVHIILDSYGRKDVLQARYDFDNGPFLSALEDRGFYVFTQSRANFNLTPVCLTSALEMDYPQNLLTTADYEAKDPYLFTRWIAHSRVRSFLHQRNYRFVVFDSGWSYTQIRDADELHGKSAIFTPYELTLLDLTLFTPITRLFKFIDYNPYEEHRQHVDAALHTMADVKDVEQPVFIFAHVLSPHPPFEIAADGSNVNVRRKFAFHDGNNFYKHKGTKKEYTAGYVAQVQYVNDALLQSIDDMRKKFVRPTVILVHGDHGPGRGLVWKNMKKTDLFERMNNFAALYLPDQDYASLYPAVTAVNYYRLIFNHLFQTNYPTLPDKSYFTDWTNLFKYTTVPESRMVN